MAATRNRLSANLPERVGAFLAARLAPDERLSVGLSGGCDSVVLLHLLSRLGYAGRLDAIHVHHGLSPNADAWAQFCADYCRRLDIPLAIRRVTVDLSSGLGLEAAARAARYAVFAETAGDCLLLAQHRGDQAETVLFNLLRGAGVTGAAGMPIERSFEGRRLLRPLLDISRAEIEAYANEIGLLWVSDESNGDTSLTRNFLRHEALVALDSRFPNAEASLAQAASNFGEAAGLLDDLADLDWRSVGAGEAARVAALKTLSLPRLKNLLRHRLRQLGWQVPVAKRLDEFARQLQVSGPDRHPELVLPGGKMRVAHRLLHWMPEKQQTVTKRLSAAIGLQLQSTDYSFQKQAMITGSIVAIVTPMHEDGSLDLNSLRKLVDFHVSEGTDAIVVVGTTGESPTVNVEEHCELIKLTVDHAAGRIPVIAGTGANSTAEAIELTEFARQAGADMALSVVPYYNKPTQEGLYRHFKAIAEAVELPVLLYNVPGRTVADMANDTILRLAEVPGIVGVKDATGSFDRACDLIARAPKGFALYSGDDMSCVSTIMMGFHGNISVTANVAPRLMHEMCVAAAAGDVARAREIQFSLLGLHRDLFCEANPIPVKWAVHKLGLMPNGIRLPLTPLSEANQARVLSAMRQAGVIA